MTDEQNDILSIADAAAYLTVSRSTLQHWRNVTRATGTQTGPVFLLMGRQIGYLRSDLLRWAQEQRHKTLPAVS